MTCTRALSLACSLLLAAPLAFGQGPGGGPPPPGGGPPPGMHGRGPEGPGGPSLGLPRGAWWKNPDTVKLLALTADQQKHLDQIFLENRAQLIQLHASLEEEQLRLEPLLEGNSFDQNKALDEISRIADLRATLEKADAKMLLSLRAVLTPDQWTKLQADQHSRREGMRGERGRRNPEGPGGQGGPLNGGPGGPPPPGATESNPDDSLE